MMLPPLLENAFVDGTPPDGGPLEVCVTAATAAEARRVLAAAPPAGTPGGFDLVFLDVEMPGDSGLAVLDAVARETTVVFVTAHPEYAVDAFEAGAIDYLLEPVDPERLEQSVAQWQADLPSAAFVRLSRSLIVNVTRLEKTQWRSRDEKLLTFLGRDDTIVIGRLAASRLREILGGRPPPDANAGGHA